MASALPMRPSTSRGKRQGALAINNGLMLAQLRLSSIWAQCRERGMATIGQAYSEIRQVLKGVAVRVAFGGVRSRERYHRSAPCR